MANMRCIGYLRRKFEVVERTLSLEGRSLRLLCVKDADSLLDREEYVREERLPYWAEVWASGLALAEYIFRNPFPPKGTVLDLGCGLGTAGIAAALAGHRVLACDHDPDALAFARCNAYLNRVASRMKFRLLNWHRPHLRGMFSYILGSDILYDRDDIRPLVKFFLRYAGGELILATPERGVERRAWEELARLGFELRSHDLVPVQEGDKVHEVHIRRWLRPQ